MDFQSLLEIIQDEPVFETGLLLAGDVDAGYIRKQLSLWGKSGRIIQLRRGLYMLAPPYQKIKPHPFLIANRMVPGSYVSCQSALAYYGLIPEYVPTTVSVTSGRPGQWETPLGNFEFRHIKPGLLYGYKMTDLGDSQQAFVAIPEKALMDLVHLHPGGDSPAYLSELRLQNLERLNLDELQRLAEMAASSKLQRAASTLVKLAQAEVEAYESLSG